MSILDDIKNLGTEVIHLFDQASAAVAKANAFWIAIKSPEMRAFVTKVAAAALKLAADASAAGTSKGLNLVLDAAVIADAEALLVAAKSGDGVIKTDLAILGIKL